MPDGSIVFSTKLDNEDLEKDLAKTKKKIASLEDEIYSNNQKRLPLIEQSKQLAAVLDEAKSRLYEMQNASKGTLGKTDVAEQRERVRGLQSEWNKVQGAVERYDRKIEDATAELNQSKVYAGELQQQISKASPKAEKMAKAMERSQKSARKFALRLREVTRSALIFTLITQGLADLRQWAGRVIKTNDDATAAIARLKGALLTMAQPLVEVIIPAFTAFVNILTSVVTVLARLVAAASGTTFEAAKDAAEALDEEQKAIEGVGNAAKKAAKQLAPFDEINRLTGESANTMTDVISADFSSLDPSKLPGWLKELTFDLEAKIGEIRFSYDEGELLKNEDAWITALTAILGLVVGGMFGGLSGSIIGLLLGVAVGLISCTFLDDLDNAGQAKEIFTKVLTAILGAVIGGIFGGLSGAIIGLLLGVAIDLISCEFFDKMENGDKAKEIFTTVLTSILGAVIGAKFGGLTGAIIGLLLGAAVSIISIEFKKGNLKDWDKNDTLTVVLSAILGAVLGAAFGGVTGAVIGLLLGATISFALVQFSDQYKGNKQEAVASLRVALLAILGLVLGAKFGGLTGGIVGLLLGLSIGFASVAFDEEMEYTARAAAKKALKIAITTIVGMLIGAIFGGGVFGGIVGGIIGLVFGLAITLDHASIEDKTGLKLNKGFDFSGSIGLEGSIPMNQIPGLATGSVIPPNREFLAVLGDNKTETEVVSPLSTMKQAMMEAMREAGARNVEMTLVLEGEMAALARVLRPYLLKEGQRVGITIVAK